MIRRRVTDMATTDPTSRESPSALHRDGDVVDRALFSLGYGYRAIPRGPYIRREDSSICGAMATLRPPGNPLYAGKIVPSRWEPQRLAERRFIRMASGTRRREKRTGYSRCESERPSDSFPPVRASSHPLSHTLNVATAREPQVFHRGCDQLVAKDFLHNLGRCSPITHPSREGSAQRLQGRGRIGDAQCSSAFQPLPLERLIAEGLRAAVMAAPRAVDPRAWKEEVISIARMAKPGECEGGSLSE